jgi:hypothetical protein
MMHKGTMLRHVELKGSKPVDPMSNDGLPEGSLPQDIVSGDGTHDGSLHRNFESKCSMHKDAMPQYNVSKGMEPVPHDDPSTLR